MRFATCFVSVAISLGITFASTNVTCAQADAPPSQKMTRLTPLVTGNGFGYAVLAHSGDVTRLYAHPYRFERPRADFSKDGYSTSNFLKKLSWSAPEGKKSIRYVSESQVMSAGGGGQEQFFYMPFGLKQNALIAILKSTNKTNQTLNVDWLHPIEQQQSKTISGREVRWLKFRGVKESVVLVPLDKGEKIQNNGALVGNAWALVVVDAKTDMDRAVNDVWQWQKNTAPAALVDREITSLEKWRVKPPYHFASNIEQRLWRQNETILRMAQIMEPNTATRFSNGLILASLPDGVWFTPWVRDMAYSVVGLVKMGHMKEARDGILSYFNARPMGRWRHETRGADYQISVTRYYGDGSEEADYSGLDTPNVEFDDWGLALWAVSEYFQKTHDMALLKTQTYRGTLYNSMKDFVVKPLLANLDKYGDGLVVARDSGLWEEHQQNKRYFAFSDIAAINGLRGFKKMAEAMNDQAEVKEVDIAIKALERGFKSGFVRDGVLVGTIDESPKHIIDGSLIEAFNFDIITDANVRQKTIDKMELLKTASGGYKRLLGDSNYEKQEFAFVNFYLARLFFKLGKPEEAQRILTRMVDKSQQDNMLIAECYVSEKNDEFPGEIGDATGSIPMVGYGAGAYILTLDERERANKLAQTSPKNDKH